MNAPNALFVAWRSLDPSVGWGPVARLDHDGQVYRFVYTNGARTLPGFRPFPQLDQLDQVYESEELFPLFANRLFSRSRPEYAAYLSWGGFDPANPPDPIAILGVTEGLRETDSIEVFPGPQPDADGCYLNRFYMHGIRWMPPAAMERINKLEKGEKLLVMPDPCNEHDPHAVAVRTDSNRTLVGYVPRYLAREVRYLLETCRPELIQVQVQQLNGEAPMQQRLLCEMRACWPPGFRPCSGAAFEPIVKAVPQANRV